MHWFSEIPLEVWCWFGMVACLVYVFIRASFSWYDGGGVPLFFAMSFAMVGMVSCANDPQRVAQHEAELKAKATPHEIGHDASGCVTMEFYQDGAGLPIRYTRCPNSTVTTESQHSESCGKGC